MKRKTLHNKITQRVRWIPLGYLAVGPTIRSILRLIRSEQKRKCEECNHIRIATEKQIEKNKLTQSLSRGDIE